MMQNENNSRQTAVNLLASVLSFLVSAGINFVLSPYLIRTLGDEAYGFIGLTTAFVQYAGILTAAVNSVAGRFIAVEYHKGEQDRAARLFSTVLAADLLLAALLLAAAAAFTLSAEHLLQIPARLIRSVKLTFALSFLSFAVSTASAVFSTAAFVKNRLEINACRDIAANLLKLAAVIGLYTLLPAQLYYLAAAALISTLFLLAADLAIKRRLLPEFRFRPGGVSASLLRELLASGVWLSFAQLCNILMTGMDLLLCNLLIGPAMMGLLSLAKAVPLCLGNLLTILGNVFSPRLTLLYAKRDTDGLAAETVFSGKLIAGIMTVPLAGFVVFGRAFHALWQPTQTPGEIGLIQLLAVLTCLCYVFSCHTQAQVMLYTACDRLKPPVLVNLAIGLLSIGAVLLSHVAGLPDGAVACVIAGASSILLALRALIFVPLYSAHILGRRRRTFVLPALRGAAVFTAVSLLYRLIRPLLPLGSWPGFLLSCLLAGALGYAVTLPLLFSRTERGRLLGWFRR